jgi:hypothetical protein
MDRGYIDFERLHAFTRELAFFVVRSKENVLLQRRYSHPVDKSTGVRSDQTVILTTAARLRPIQTCSPRGLLRCRHRQAAEVSDQQLHSARADHRANLQAALAGGAVFREYDMMHSSVCH